MLAADLDGGRRATNGNAIRIALRSEEIRNRFFRVTRGMWPNEDLHDIAGRFQRQRRFDIGLAFEKLAVPVKLSHNIHNDVAHLTLVYVLLALGCQAIPDQLRCDHFPRHGEEIGARPYRFAKRAVSLSYPACDRSGRFNDKPVARLGSRATVNDAAHLEILICMLLQRHLGRREQGRGESNREAAPMLTVVTPLLWIVFMAAEAEKVELECVGEGVIVEHVDQAGVKMLGRAIVAVAHLLNYATRDFQRIFELLPVPLVLMAEAPELFMRENPLQRVFASVVIERSPGRAGILLFQKLRLGPGVEFPRSGLRFRW